MSTRPQTVYTLLVLCAINALNFLDRQVLFAVAEPLRHEWNLSDTALGVLGTAFILVYAIAGIPLGRLADQASRRTLLAAATCAWSVLTAASGLARGFWQLAALRLGVGVGEAVCAPAATSLIGDLVPAQRRARSLSVFMLGLPVGLSLGYAMGGMVADVWGWRAAFWIAGLPGLVAALATLAIREPEHGFAAPRSPVPSSHLPAIRLVVASPAMRWIIASGVLHNLVMYAFSSFLSPFIVRVHHVSVSEAGLLSMLAYGVAGGIGLLASGFLGDAARRRRPDGAMRLAALATALAAPCLALAVTQAEGRLAAFSIFTAAFCALMYVYYSNVYATIQDIIEPRLRGTAMAVYFFAMYVLGAAVGPVGAGFLSDVFAARSALAAGVAVITQQTVEPFRAAGLQGAMATLPVLGVALTLTLAAGARATARHAARGGSGLS